MVGTQTNTTHKKRFTAADGFTPTSKTELHVKIPPVRSGSCNCAHVYTINFILLPNLLTNERISTRLVRRTVFNGLMPHGGSAYQKTETAHCLLIHFHNMDF